MPPSYPLTCANVGRSGGSFKNRSGALRVNIALGDFTRKHLRAAAFFYNGEMLRAVLRLTWRNLAFRSSRSMLSWGKYSSQSSTRLHQQMHNQRWHDPKSGRSCKKDSFAAVLGYGHKWQKEVDLIAWPNTKLERRASHVCIFWKYMLNFVAHDFVTCMVRITANQMIFA